MNVRKAMRRAAAKSLDGHCRFVAHIGRKLVVLTLSELPHFPKARILVAFAAGKSISPRCPLTKAELTQYTRRSVDFGPPCCRGALRDWVAVGSKRRPRRAH